MTPVRRRSRLRLVVLALGIAAVVPPPSASAQTDAPALGGYVGSAAASGLHLRYGLENFLPIGPPVDLGVPDALATISTGPTTYARASAADPGDVLANPDALISAGSDDWQPGTIPPYAYRAEATSASGEPTAQASPAPGFEARAEAGAQRSAAAATAPATDAAPLLRTGSMTSDAEAVLDEAVTVRSRSEVHDVDLLGVVTVDAVVTQLEARSDGGEPELSGGTELSGLRVLDQDVTFEDGELRKAGDGPGAADLTEALAAAGIRITFAGPVEQAGGSTGRLATSGLRIDVEVSEQTLPVLTALRSASGGLADALPGVETPLGDVTGATGIRHVLSFEIGRGAVSLQAQPASSFDVTLPPVGPDAPAVPSLAGAAPSAPSSSGGTASPITPSGPAPGATAIQPASTEAEASPLSTGIGAAALLLLLVQPFLGHRLAAVPSAVLAPQTATTCPREGR